MCNTPGRRDTIMTRNQPCSLGGACIMCRLFLFRYEIFSVKTKKTHNVLLSFFYLM